MSSINVAIIGVGNCASSLVQGVHKYSEADPEQEIPGIMNTLMDDYHIGDIKIVAAFDIDKEKVGKDLSEAIYMNNNALKFHEVPKTGVIVQRGMTHDGLGKYLSALISKAPGAINLLLIASATSVSGEIIKSTDIWFLENKVS